MNASKQSSREASIRSVISTCHMIVIVACSLLVFAIVGVLINLRDFRRSFFEPEMIAIFVVFILFPIASGVAFWLLSIRIRRGSRRAAIAAIALAILWFCFFLILAVIVFIEWSSSTHYGHADSFPFAFLGMIFVLGIGYLPIARNLIRSLPSLHLLADRPPRGFEVLDVHEMKSKS